ncbi:epidermal growth factor receptor kinase substrate 8-like protein 1 isoform X3 [Cyprinodon tularosa]|uniref:epidermal growth factor receptor kinase substrate 8-like protein 1 isoform X3 n=1 Tax=Cyprinodon variegatus TaxID=28743 RepID=UPI000742AAEE|nr:PREDICTED: epidermal growth factor receptor kinase substrate 8-like protein 1 isoform X3 [Cyprinodon variegatus]XP_038156872.1 epidermal growth factor receptor kinase substrate 8-like protein 1 isoform X3 [Cyprinodon tularosa]
MKHLVDHLLTFSLQGGDVEGVEEAQARLSFLAENNKLWSQKMLMDIGSDSICLRDIKTEDELERYSFKDIYRCDPISMEKHFPSLFLLVCKHPNEKKPDIHFFNSESMQAAEICEDIKNAVSGRPNSRSSKNAPEGNRPPSSKEKMYDAYGIPNPPFPYAPNPPPVNPPPYPGLRANGINGGPDLSFLRAEREVMILNHCFDDIETFMGKLQQTAEASTVLNQRKKKKKKNKKQSAEDDLLTEKARPPPEEEFIDIFQKFKYCFCLLARLKSTIANPSSEELVHHVFRPLDMMVKTTGGPAFGASVSSPAMTSSAISLLQDTLTGEEKELWTALGPNWTNHRSQLRGPVAPYTPVFLDGWKPEAERADGQVWEDPVESQHKHEAHRVKQEQQQHQQPHQQLSPPESIYNKGEGPSAEAQRIYMCSYDFNARNNTELSVQHGETLEVLESSKRWWKCRNRYGEVGFVPFNILEPVDHTDNPVTNKPPSAPAPPPLNKSITPVPPSPPALLSTPSHSPQRPRTSPTGSQHVPVADETDKVMLVNDELLQRLTNGKTNLNKPLVIHRAAETSVPLDYHSPPEEVTEWLRRKGFSEPTVQCLSVLTGAQLFSLNKEELRAVLPDEGVRVYSQLAVQKAQLEDARRATELEAVMEKQKMKVDLELESSTL